MRRLARLTLATALTVSTAACGSDDHPETKDTPTKAGTSATPGTPGKPGKALALADLAGLLDRQLDAKKTVKMTVSTEGAVQGTVTLSTLGGARELEITVPKDASGDAAHYLSLKDGIYSKEPGAPDKPWLKFPKGTKNVQGRLYAALIGAMGAIMEAAQPKELLTAGGTLTGTTPEKTDGVDTLHYKATVDVAKGLNKIDKKAYVARNWALIQDITARDRKKGAELPATLTDAQANTLAARFAAAMKGRPATFEFWIDAQNVPRKYAFSLPARKDANAILTFAEWGTAKITPPPPDQVAIAPDTPPGRS